MEKRVYTGKIVNSYEITCNGIHYQISFQDHLQGCEGDDEPPQNKSCVLGIDIKNLSLGTIYTNSGMMFLRQSDLQKNTVTVDDVWIYGVGGRDVEKCLEFAARDLLEQTDKQKIFSLPIEYCDHCEHDRDE